MDITISVSHPTGSPGPKSRAQMGEDGHGVVTWAMDEPHRVAIGRSYPEDNNDVCPVWGDRLPWKSVTVVVDAEDEADAIFCLECCHGGASVSRRKVLDDGRVALRSDYQCW